MQHLIIDAPAGQISAELQRRGLPADAHVRVTVEYACDAALPMSAIAQAGKAQDWLTTEPDLYSDADLVPHAS